MIVPLLVLEKYQMSTEKEGTHGGTSARWVAEIK